MKLLVDMNLSPSWVERLERHGFEAVHWFTIGAATAPDVEILAYAHRHKLVLITNDLDFSATGTRRTSRQADAPLTSSRTSAESTWAS